MAKGDGNGGETVAEYAAATVIGSLGVRNHIPGHRVTGTEGQPSDGRRPMQSRNKRKRGRKKREEREEREEREKRKKGKKEKRNGGNGSIPS